MRKICILSYLFLNSFLLLAESRFPKPEFTNKYESPIIQQPLPAHEWLPYVSLGLLLIVIILTGLAVYKWRSRKIQIALLIFSLAFFGFFREGCVCAIGSIQNVTAALADVNFSLSIPVLGFFLLPLLTALFFGRLFCGAACPMGALQELVLLRPVKVPRILDRTLRLIPPLYLGAAVLFAFCGLGFIICSWDPFVGFFRLSGSFTMLLTGLIIVILSLFVARPYCRYICPYSVLLRIAAVFSPRQVSITPDECIKCRLCENACPSDVIIPPRPKKYSEPGFLAIRRVQLLLAITPGIIALGIIGGYLLAKPAESLDPKINLLQNIKSGNIQNEEVSAFLATGTPLIDLTTEVKSRKERLKIAWMLLGAWAGMVISANLIYSSRRRHNEDFITDRLNCVCCSRCYEYCPKSGNAGVPPAKNRNAGVPPANANKNWHSRGYLPHFDGEQAIQFITFRLHDSVPAKVIETWKNELNWTENIDANSKESIELRRKIAKYEDTGYGECYLKEARIAKIVQDTLFYYDGGKYKLLEWSIMPNHVHVLIHVKKGHSLSTIIHSWKSFSAHQANKYLKRTGSFWNADYFDRYIRDEKHYLSTIEYIRLNPVKAGLVNSPEDWEWSGSMKENTGGENEWKGDNYAGGTPAVPERG